MESKGKIQPQWGINHYKRYGCKFFEFSDPEMRFSVPISTPYPNKIYRTISKQFKQIGEIHCYQCMHLDTEECLYSRKDIEEKEMSYKKVNMRCHICNSKLRSFHGFLLLVKNGTFYCKECYRKKRLGKLKRSLEKDLKPNWFELIRGTVYILAMIAPMIIGILSLFKGETPDYSMFAISFVAFIIICFVGIPEVKVLRKKKQRLKELE